MLRHKINPVIYLSDNGGPLNVSRMLLNLYNPPAEATPVIVACPARFATVDLDIGDDFDGVFEKQMTRHCLCPAGHDMAGVAFIIYLPTIPKALHISVISCEPNRGMPN
jgi:hypothetical protein